MSLHEHVKFDWCEAMIGLSDKINFNSYHTYLKKKSVVVLNKCVNDQIKLSLVHCYCHKKNKTWKNPFCLLFLFTVVPVSATIVRLRHQVPVLSKY